MTATIDMPGSTHEIALSLDGRTAYALGLWRRRFRQARQSGPPHRGDRPAVEVAHARDRSRRRLRAARRDDGRARTLWSSGELGNAVLAIDPATDKVEKIDVGATAHWVAISHALGKVFVSVKQDRIVVVDIARRTRRSIASSFRMWSKGSQSRPTAARSTSARRARPSST